MDKAVPIAAPRFSYLADPFLLDTRGSRWLLAEKYSYTKALGSLVAAALDDEMRTGAFEPIELASGCHASFPFVFEHEGLFHLVPETCADRTISLYVTDDPPFRWRLARHLLTGVDAADTVLFQHDGLWWMMTSVRIRPDGNFRSLALFYAQSLDEPWHPHPHNEFQWYGNSPGSGGRNAGAPFRADGRLFRPVQVNRRYYGEKIVIMEILQLDPDSFHEAPAELNHPLIRLSRTTAMHHIHGAGALIAFDQRMRAPLAGVLPILAPTRNYSTGGPDDADLATLTPYTSSPA